MIDSSNLTQYVLENYGRKRQDLSIVIPMIIIYIIIFITGVFGNVATCLIIAKNRYMQTPTNAYLFNLAVADLIVLILGLPHEICITWQTYPDIFGGIFCVARALIAETSTYASILTITAFTAERYVAICHPMWSHTMSKIKRAIKIIIIIWFVSLVCAAPLASQFGIKNLQWNITGEEIDGTEICDVVRPLERVFEISSFLFFFTPMTVIGALYALIGWTIRKSTINRTGSDISDQSGHPTDFRTQQQSRARRAVLKMLGKYNTC
ncbi:DgyrCDS13413 [Dimorphilus gyrociliatus]|uniref:DgyrCDS13413 n=1 Tax=Dimorphilus gyrociliatus TaxID=2664684 RepID=A0A7I8WAK2_9ANNE|nr:DgyrCDS13413 [Dimorphilus gyrociliatus]